MPLTPMPFVAPQWFDNNGDPAAGHLLFTYEAGTTTKLATYSDVDGLVANTNPIVLDASGRATIFWLPQSYKAVLAPPTDTDPPTSPIWTRDDVAAVPSFSVDLDIPGTAGEALTAGQAVYLSAGDGGKTSGRWYKTSATNAYSALSTSALGMVPTDIASGASGTIRMIGRMDGLSGLTTGSVYYLAATAGTITLTAPTLARKIGMADSSTSLVISQWAPQYDYGSPLYYVAPGGTAVSGVPAGIYRSGTVVGNVGTGEDTLMTKALDAGAISTDLMSIGVLAWGKTANNANAKTIKGYFGATQVFGGSGAVLTVSELGNWIAGFRVMRLSATTQTAAAQFLCGPAGAAASKSFQATTSPAETLANAITVKFTGEATTDNDITQEGMVIMLYP